jgi:hypothetical protein
METMEYSALQVTGKGGRGRVTSGMAGQCPVRPDSVFHPTVAEAPPCAGRSPFGS